MITGKRLHYISYIQWLISVHRGGVRGSRPGTNSKEPESHNCIDGEIKDSNRPIPSTNE